MILKLYRGHDPGTILLILLTGSLIWFQAFLHPIEVASVSTANPMPLYVFLKGLFDGKALAGTIFSFSITLIIGFYLVNFNTRLFFINERTFLPAALYILLSGFFTSLQTLNPVYPAVLLIIIAFDRLVSTYRKQGIAYNFFDASLLISAASLIYFNAIWCFIVVIIGVLLLRTVSIREIAFAVFGLITPYVIVISWYYMAGKDLNSLVSTIVANITQSSLQYYWSPAMIIISSVSGLIILIAIAHLWSVFNTKKVRSRKTFSLLIWLMVITLMSYLIIPAVSVEIFHIFLLPAAYFLSHFLIIWRNKKIANAIFAIIFILVVILQLS